MTSEQHHIEPKKSAFVQLAADLAQLKDHFKQFQQCKKDLLDASDVEKIQNKDFIKKTGWVKLAVAFNLTTRIIEERKEANAEDPTKYAYHFTVECEASNGRKVQEVGTCDNTEKDEAEHIVRAMAKTRATSRAISSMIGQGEPSAEEMQAVKNKAESNFCKCSDANKAANPAKENKCPICNKLRSFPGGA